MPSLLKNSVSIFPNTPYSRIYIVQPALIQYSGNTFLRFHTGIKIKFDMRAVGRHQNQVYIYFSFWENVIITAPDADFFEISSFFFVF